MIAFICPGQGSQYVGMGKDLYEGSPVARALFDEVAGQLDFSLLDLMFEGPAEDLTRTENAQPALLTHSAAVCAMLNEAGIRAAVVAGHSLGEYSALVAAGALTPTAGTQLVRTRGLLMAQVGREVGGTMAAVIGLDQGPLEQVVEQAGESGIVCMANLNAPGQIVISGDEAAVKRAAELASEAGARRVIPLNVSGAFHSPLMQPAATQFAEVLEQAEIGDAAIPVVSNVDAIERTAAADLRQALLAQLTASVRWHDCVGRMIALGVTQAVEVGPGKVLTNMLKRSAPDIQTFNADTLDDVNAVISALS